MLQGSETIDAALKDAERLRQILKKSRSPQVRSVDECGLAKATAITWFSSYRPLLETSVVAESLDLADLSYRTILESSDRHGARPKYLTTLSELRRHLIKLRTELIAAKPAATNDNPPDFSPLVSDAEMKRILVSRWNECVLCLSVGAALAATVMMGGLLEALLLSRINKEPNKSALFTAKAAPKNAKTLATKSLSEWMLNDFIQVLSELRWITVSATAVGVVLRDYRNYIHPQKQLSHSLHLKAEDAQLFWEVTKNITRQVISNAAELK